MLKPPLLLCSCRFPLLWLLVFALCIEVLLFWVHMYLQLLYLLLGLISWSLCSVLPCPFILKSILSDMTIATPALFWFPFAWNIFFHPHTCSLYVSLDLKWVSYRQHTYRSCFCIHSASLCLLAGAFNPFTFKVIIDVSITTFLIVLHLFLEVFFFSCVSGLEKFL